MSTYRPAKAVEHRLKLAGLQRSLAAFRQNGLPHSIVLDTLEREAQRLARGLTLLDHALAIPGLEDEAADLSKDLAQSFRVISEQYIAGLRHQSAEELDARRLALSVCRRLNLVWVKDIVVRYTGVLAIYPEFRNDCTVPVLYAPPNLFDSVLCLPGIHHEFGHSVHAANPNFTDELTRVVEEFFETQRLALGPARPRRRDQQLVNLTKAQEYWTPARLAEIFCDVFAGYVCGPANLISVIDLHLEERDDPFNVMPEDHPPGAARVLACSHALLPSQRSHPLVQASLDDWEKHTQEWIPAPGFPHACQEALVAKLAQKATELIAQLSPTIPRFTDSLPDLNDALRDPPGVTLETAINAGATILLSARTEFPRWWAHTRPLLV